MQNHNPSGGITSYITGGGILSPPKYDPLQGAAQGLVVYFANHLAHGREPTLQERLNKWIEDNKGQIETLTGETGIEKVLVGSNENFKRYGLKYKYLEKFGHIYVKATQEYAAGATEAGKAFDKTIEGYIRLSKNLVFLSKNTVKNLFDGSFDAYKTVVHEFKHANLMYSGIQDKVSTQFNYDLNKTRAYIENMVDNFIIETFK